MCKSQTPYILDPWRVLSPYPSCGEILECNLTTCAKAFSLPPNYSILCFIFNCKTPSRFLPIYTHRLSCNNLRLLLSKCGPLQVMNKWFWSSFLMACAQTIIAHQEWFSLVLLMLVSYYWQHMSIALQPVQTITILQQAAALDQCSLFLPHIIAKALLSLANFWQMATLSSYVSLLSLIVIS